MKLSKAFTTLCLALTAVSALAAPIELNKADSRLNSKYGYSWQSIEVEAIVDNLAYEKSVQLYYQDETNAWVTADMAFEGTASPGRELWKYSVQRTITGPYTTNAPLDLNFVLKYTVNGQTHWDNNNGANYVLNAGTGEYTPKVIVLNHAYANAPYTYSYNGMSQAVKGYFSANFILQNLGYSKDVEVHYSFDNWATSHVGKAKFNSGMMEGYSYISYPNANGVEVWSFYTNGEEAQNANATQVQFAVKYSVAGATYWNSNQGANFTIPVSNNSY